MIANLKDSLIFIAQNAQIIDYLAYGFNVLMFFLFIFLGLLCAAKWWWQIGFLIIFSSFILFFVGIYFTNLELNKRVRNVEISGLKTKQLEYSNTLLVDFDIENKSKKELKICKLDIKFHTISKNGFKNYINSLNPFLTKTITIKDILYKGETKHLNAVVNNFLFVDYNITTKAECF